MAFPGCRFESSGHQVSISGDVILVGAYRDSLNGKKDMRSELKGLAPGQHNVVSQDSGSAYIFRRELDVAWKHPDLVTC